MNVLGVIPARGGSKGIPRKNLVDVAGKSLLAHAVKSASQAELLHRCVVSTEDDEIAAVARGLEVSVVDRPDELARDEARTEPVLLHAVDTLAKAGFEADIVVTLEPTSPLREPGTIDRCIQRLKGSSADAAVTVVADHGLFGRIEENRFIHLVEDQPRRRQDRDPLYRESSTVYANRVATLRREGSVVGGDVIPVVIDEEEAVDIDTPVDLDIARAVLARRGEASRDQPS